MLSSLFLPFLAFVATLVPNALQALATPSRYTVCLDYLLIITRGPEDGSCPHCTFAPMMRDTLAGLHGGSEVDIIYEPGMAPGNVKEAASQLSDFVSERFIDCPKEKYALLGFKTGATATTMAAANLTSNVHNWRIKAVVLMSNPDRVPTLQGNVNENGKTLKVGSIGLPSAGSSSGMQKYADTGRLLDICLTGDGACDSRGPRRLDLKAADKYTYSNSIQSLGTRFLLSKLRA